MLGDRTNYVTGELQVAWELDDIRRGDHQAQHSAVNARVAGGDERPVGRGRLRSARVAVIGDESQSCSVEGREAVCRASEWRVSRAIVGPSVGRDRDVIRVEERLARGVVGAAFEHR